MDSIVNVKIVRSDDKEFWFNNGSDWRITELDNFGSLENDITTTDFAVGDGAIISSSRVGQKDRTISARSKDPSKNDAIRAKALSFFNPKYTYKIYGTYMGVTRWCDAHLHKMTLPNGNIHRIMDISVTFMCPIPWFKSVDDFGKNIAEITPMIAFPFLCSNQAGTTKGFTAGIYKYADAVLFSNDGDVDTYCKAIITAKGRVVNPCLIVGDSYVRVIDEMAAGDVIEMDFTAMPPTVKKNSVNCIGKCDRTSDFDDMALKVGKTEVSYRSDDGTSNIGVYIFYNKLYLGI